MQRNTIVPMLMMVAMFGMFIHYDLTSSTQYSVIDSVWPSVILMVITFVIIVVRQQNKHVDNLLLYIIFAPLLLVIGLISFLIKPKSGTAYLKMDNTNTQTNDKPKQKGSNNTELKENLHHSIIKMLDESDKYDEFTVNTILKELEKIK